jgi:hypothetical protein
MDILFLFLDSKNQSPETDFYYILPDFRCSEPVDRSVVSDSWAMLLICQGSFTKFQSQLADKRSLVPACWSRVPVFQSGRSDFQSRVSDYQVGKADREEL